MTNDLSGALKSRPDLQAKVMRKVALRLIPFLAVAYFLNYIDRSDIGVAELTMSEDIGLTETAFGIASAVFFVGCLLRGAQRSRALSLRRSEVDRAHHGLLGSGRRRHGLHPGRHRPLHRSLLARHRRGRLRPWCDPVPDVVVPACDAGPAHRTVHARPADLAGDRQPTLGRRASLLTAAAPFRPAARSSPRERRARAVARVECRYQPT